MRKQVTTKNTTKPIAKVEHENATIHNTKQPSLLQEVHSSAAPCRLREKQRNAVTGVGGDLRLTGDGEGWCGRVV